MKERVITFIQVVLMIGVAMTGITFMYTLEGNARPSVEDTIIAPPIDTVPVTPSFIGKSAEEGLREALSFYKVEHPDIVYAQAILETGHFKSMGCIKDNNLFGLYNSKANRYCRFNHWTESVIAYKEWIQRRYKPPENYYKFLMRIRYASHPQYIPKLKQIVKKEDDKRRYAEGNSLPQRV